MELKTILACAAILAIITGPASASSATWSSGGSANMGTAGNWSGGSGTSGTPASGDSWTFGATTGTKALTDNLTTGAANWTVAGITFSSSAAAYTISPASSSNGFTLTGGITNSSSSKEVINDNITISANSGSQAWTSTSGTVTINGNLTDSATGDTITISGNGANGTTLPSFQLGGSNSNYLGTISFSTSGNSGSGILLESAAAMTGGLIDTTNNTHNALWLTSNTTSAPYTFGIQGTQTTGARVNVSGSGGNGFFLTDGGSAGGVNVYWDPGNGSTYNWSGTGNTTDATGSTTPNTVLTFAGSNDTNPDTLVIGDAASPGSAYFEISGASKSFLVYAVGNNPGYVTLDDGLEAGTSNLTLSSTLPLLTLTSAAITTNPLGITLSSKGGQLAGLSISNVNQLPGGNLNLNGGVLILNGLSWDSFAYNASTNPTGYQNGSGNNQYQITLGTNGGGINQIDGGFASVGNITIDTNGTNASTFSTGFTLGSTALTSSGTEYATGNINLATPTTFTASAETNFFGGNSTVSSGVYTLGTQVMTLSGQLTGKTGGTTLTFNGLNGSVGTFVPIVELTNANNTLLNIATGSSVTGTVSQNYGVLVTTSDAALGGGTVTFNSAGQGWLLEFAGGYNSSEAISFAASSSVSGASWGLGSYTGADVYTGVSTINVSSSTTATIPLTWDAESGSTLQFGTSGTAATFTNNSNAANTQQYRKTGAGTVILNNVTYNGTDTNAVQFSILNGALQETGGTAANSVYGSSLTLSGGVLETNNTNESAESGGTNAFTRALSTTLSSSSVNMTNGGGFSANGGALTVALGGTSAPTALSWNNSTPTAGWVGYTGTLVFGSQTADNVVTFQNAIAIGGSSNVNRTIDVIGNSSSGTLNEAVMSGVISGTGTLNLVGTGSLVLTAADTFTGTTNVLGGTLVVDNTFATSTLTVSSGAALGGTGSIAGPVVISAGGAINLHGSGLTAASGTGSTPVIGKLTVGSLTINNTSGTSLPALTFDINSGSSSNLDSIAVTGALTFGGTNGITINIDNEAGSSTLSTGTYTLISYGGATGSLTTAQFGYFSISDPTLDGDSLTLKNGSNLLQLVVGATLSTSTYTLAESAGTTKMHVGGTSTLTTTITNTGSSNADSITYSGLGATPTGSVTGATASGTVTSGGGTGTGTQTFTTSTAGSNTFTATVSSANNSTLGGSATLSGTAGTATVTVYRYAAPSTLTSTVTLANVHAGSAFGTSTLSLSNTAANDGYSESLDAGFTGSTGSATGTGTVNLLAAGGTNTTTLVVGLGTASTGGLISGTETVSLTSDGQGTSGLGTSPLGTQTVTVKGAAYNYAAASTLTSTVTLANVHVGSAFGTSTLSLTNTAATGSYSESLDAGFTGSTGSATGTGTVSLLAAGSTSSSNLVVGLGTASAGGSVSGTETVTLTSDGQGTSGLGTTGLGTQTVTVKGAAYNYATGSLTSAVNLGVVHIGGTFGTSTLTVNNTAPTGGYSESLDAGFGGTTGGVTTNSGTISLLAAGSSNTTGLAVSASSATAGALSGTATVTLTSDGQGTSGLGTTNLSSGTVTVTGFVYTGVGVWNTNGGGAWGTTETTAPANWTATGGIPGITPGFLTTDSASFGSVTTSGTATVTLSGASPYLNAITFNNSAATYDIEQGGTGTLHLDSTTTATVTVSAGSHIIGAPIELDSAAATAVAASSTLTINGTISQSGTQSLALTGAGTTILSGANTYGGTTSVSAGTLLVSNTSAGGSATGTGSLSVSGGATIGGYGTSSGTGFSLSGSSTSNRANVLVGLNSATDTNTSHVLTLKGTGASTIAYANLTFNLDAKSQNSTQLAVGNTNITFGAGVKLTLNLQNEPAIVGAYTPYILIAGTGVTTDTGGMSGGQYSGLTLGAVTADTRGGTDTLITGSNLQLAFGSSIDTSYYGSHSYLVLYQNGSTDDIEVEVVPEPGTWALMLGGLAMLIFWQRRKNRS